MWPCTPKKKKEICFLESPAWSPSILSPLPKAALGGFSVPPQTEALCTKGLVATIFTEPSNWTFHKKVTIEIKVDLDCLERWIGRKMELTLCRYAILFSVVTLLYCLRIHITYYLERFFLYVYSKLDGAVYVCVYACERSERQSAHITSVSGVFVNTFFINWQVLLNV